jgi:hypothetical protein
MDEERGRHRAQLLVCHEKIAGNTLTGARISNVKQFCDLSAYAWCFTCAYYVCDIHLNSRHNGKHDTLIEFPKQTVLPGRKLTQQASDDPNPTT